VEDDNIPNSKYRDPLLCMIRHNAYFKMIDDYEQLKRNIQNTCMAQGDCAKVILLERVQNHFIEEFRKGLTISKCENDRDMKPIINIEEPEHERLPTALHETIKIGSSLLSTAFPDKR